MGLLDGRTLQDDMEHANPGHSSSRGGRWLVVLICAVVGFALSLFVQLSNKSPYAAGITIFDLAGALGGMLALLFIPYIVGRIASRKSPEGWHISFAIAFVIILALVLIGHFGVPRR